MAQPARTGRFSPDRPTTAKRAVGLPAARWTTRHRTANEPDARYAAPGQLPVAGTGPGRRAERGKTGRSTIGPGRHTAGGDPCPGLARSEEHTSELQSLMRNSYDDFCLK